MKKSCKRAIVILMSLLFLVLADAGCGAETSVPQGASAEEHEIYEAARKYLDAEAARELKTVFDCLAPSSIYLTTHDYVTYLAEAGASPVRIREYKILRVKHIRINEDKKQFPHVEKFAEVEVDMKVFFTDTNQAAGVNFNFTFVKEGGRWYKG